MLTNAQLQTLKADIEANPDLAAIPNTADASFAVADLYNAQASPDFHVFKSSVSTDDARDAIDWNEVLNGSPLSVVKQWAFNTLIANGTFDPSLVNTRVGFTEIFPGQAYAGTRNNLLTISTRLATRFEKLFSVNGTGPGGGNGSASTSSAVMTVEGQVTPAEIQAARNLP